MRQSTIHMERRRSLSIQTGPIPPAEELEALDAVVPGAAERIIATFERQVTHRHGLESRKLAADIRSERRGSYQGLAIAITALLVAAYLGYAGHGVAAGVVGGIDIAALAAVFVIGRTTLLRELDRKRRGDDKRA
jgi:uncharacterized membrane protein